MGRPTRSEQINSEEIANFYKAHQELERIEEEKREKKRREDKEFLALIKAKRIKREKEEEEIKKMSKKKTKKELKDDEERALLSSQAEAKQRKMMELLGGVSTDPEPYLYKDWSKTEEKEIKEEPVKKRGRPKKEEIKTTVEVSVPKEKKEKKNKNKHIFSATAELVEGNKSIQLKTDIAKGLSPKEKKALKKSVIRAFEDHIDGSGIYVDLQGNYTTSLMTIPMGKYIDPEDTEMMKTLTRETQAPKVKSIKSGVINGSGLRIHRKTHVTPNGKLLVFDTSSDEDSTDSDDEGVFHGTGLMDLINSTKNKSIAFKKNYDEKLDDYKTSLSKRKEELKQARAKKIETQGGHFEKPHH